MQGGHISGDLKPRDAKSVTLDQYAEKQWNEGLRSMPDAIAPEWRLLPEDVKAKLRERIAAAIAGSAHPA